MGKLSEEERRKRKTARNMERHKSVHPRGLLDSLNDTQEECFTPFEDTGGNRAFYNLGEGSRHVGPRHFA